jgi:Ser/Thr protein kinase RdoA (MazF antagonist)
MKPDFDRIVDQFNFEGEFATAEPYGIGHINDTYIANFAINGSSRRYILQRINHHVFRDPPGLMSNIEAVTTHLRQKIISAGGDPERETLTLIPTVDGNSFIQTDQGEYWRGYLFINNARTYESIENPDHVFHAASAFGNFQKLLSDYPSENLIETIPDFHNTSKRFKAFTESVEKDELNRGRLSKEEIEFVMQRVSDTSILVEKIEKGELPERITHNDTKFNNVMIDNETGTGVCVIDLDTVMPGLSLYDFGDAIRTLANPAAEDERDLSLVNFDFQVFDLYTHGYLDAVGNELTSQEKDYLAFSAILMTLECGIRFLTDHLQGDKYFKIHREDHNLDRCRTQFKLVLDMETHFDEMQRIVEKYR